MVVDKQLNAHTTHTHTDTSIFSTENTHTTRAVFQRRASYSFGLIISRADAATKARLFSTAAATNFVCVAPLFPFSTIFRYTIFVASVD